jgi:glutaconate CoA-transferase subunit A
MADITNLREAVSSLVRDGDTVALEGFTHLIPFAAGHELIRQQRKNLTLVRMTPDVIYDQMIGAGCARKLIFSGGGNPGVGSLHRLRDAVEHTWPAPLEIQSTATAIFERLCCGCIQFAICGVASLRRFGPSKTQ